MVSVHHLGLPVWNPFLSLEEAMWTVLIYKKKSPKGFYSIPKGKHHLTKTPLTLCSVCWWVTKENRQHLDEALSHGLNCCINIWTSELKNSASSTLVSLEMSSNHGRIQAGGALRSLVRPPAQAGPARGQTRQLGVYPGAPWKPAGTEIHSRCVSLSRCCTALSLKKFLLLSGQNCLLKSQAAASILPPCTTKEAGGTSAITPSPALRQRGLGEAEAVLWMGPDERWAEGGNHFPPPTVSAPANEAPGALRLPCWQDTLLAPAELAVPISFALRLHWYMFIPSPLLSSSSLPRASLRAQILHTLFSPRYVHSCVAPALSVVHVGNCQNVNGALQRRDLPNDVRARSL